MKRFRHIPVRAGSVVFFDNRIPHASAYRNDSDQARAVIYCSFLPDVPMNRRYAERQLLLYKRRIKPDDQWINLSESKATEEPEGSNPLSELARKLLLLEEWE
jgi:ectoine hydroxylase-related dioxygenase (phytanoyl-CoA dioxygenase family)